MNCENLRNLLDKANEMAANNIWGGKAYAINMKILGADNNNFTACNRLAQYYKLNNNRSDAKKMYLRALEIYPNNHVVKNNLNEIERINKETKFIDRLTTSRECFDSGRKLTREGHHWLAGECYFKAYGIEPVLKYGISLAKSYIKLGKQNKIKELFKELMDSSPSLEMKEDIKVEFAELLKGWKEEKEKVFAL